MKGQFEYVGADYRVHKCDDSADIPADAKEMVLFYIPNRPEPHSQEDHEHDEQIMVEFNRIKQMIYGGGHAGSG